MQHVITEDVSPMASTITGESTRERKDAVTAENPSDDDQLVAPLAPQSELGFFVVTRVLE